MASEQGTINPEPVMKGKRTYFQLKKRKVSGRTLSFFKLKIEHSLHSISLVLLLHFITNWAPNEADGTVSGTRSERSRTFHGCVLCCLWSFLTLLCLYMWCCCNGSTNEPNKKSMTKTTLCCCDFHCCVRERRRHTLISFTCPFFIPHNTKTTQQTHQQ